MARKIETGKGSKESPKEFTARVLRLQHEAIRISQSKCGDNAELNRWIAVVKQRGMTWVGGLAFAVERMKADPVQECLHAPA